MPTEVWYSNTEVAHGAAYSGHYRQVVLIQRCGIVTLIDRELPHGAALGVHGL